MYYYGRPSNTQLPPFTHDEYSRGMDGRVDFLPWHISSSDIVSRMKTRYHCSKLLDQARLVPSLQTLERSTFKMISTIICSPDK